MYFNILELKSLSTPVVNILVFFLISMNVTSIFVCHVFSRILSTTLALLYRYCPLLSFDRIFRRLLQFTDCFIAVLKR